MAHFVSDQLLFGYFPMVLPFYALVFSTSLPPTLNDEIRINRQRLDLPIFNIGE